MLARASRSTLISAAFVLVGTAGALVSAPANAGWQEVHQTSDDVRFDIAADGTATVVHHLRYRVVAGRFKSFDFTGPGSHVEPAAVTVTPRSAAPDGAVSEKAADVTAHLEASAKNPGGFKIAIDDPKGVGKGSYAIDVSYPLDLVGAKMLTRDGAMWRLAWTARPSPEGHDGARVTFALPTAATEPRVVSEDEGATVLGSLRRLPETDELELVRAHVPRGETVTWAARVDPKAFPKVTNAELRPPPAPVVDRAPSRAPAALLAVSLTVLVGLLTWLLRAKQASVAAACEAHGVTARPLVKLPFGAGPLLFGVAATGGLSVLVLGTPLLGAALVVVAMALATHRRPRAVSRPRGPGRWRMVPDDKMLARPRATDQGTAWLDATTPRGAASAALVTLTVAGAAFALRHHVAGILVALPLAASALVPVFVTGTRRQLPPRAEELARSVLRRVRDGVAKATDLAHVDLGFIARFAEGTTEIDEVRLICAPKDKIPGLRCIELALTSAAVASREVLPELLVRYEDGTAAAAKIAQLAPGLPVVVGRVAEERVLRLVPTSPTAAFAARLLARVTSDLEGRREGDRSRTRARKSEPQKRGRRAAWNGKDRRGPRVEVAAERSSAPAGLGVLLNHASC